MGAKPDVVRVPPAVRVGAGIAMLLAFGLGVWQVRRDGERNLGREAALIAEKLPPLGDGEPVGPDSAWRMVAWRGHFEGTPELIGGRMEGDALGYGVAQRFVRLNGEAMLVDRGWVPAEAAEREVIRLTSPVNTTLAGQLRPALGGAAAVPVAGHGARIWPAKAWPSILRTLDAEIHGALYVVAGPTNEVFGEEESSPKGSVVGVPVRDDTSLHYASQWFAISLIMGIVVVPAAITRARDFLGA